MTDGLGDSQAWQQLGRALIQRRVTLDPRFRNRRVFCETRQIDYRLIFDIETSKRTNFSTATLLDIARAYMIEPDSISAVLHGEGDLEPGPGSPGAASPTSQPEPLPEPVNDGHLAARAILDAAMGSDPVQAVMDEVWEEIRERGAEKPFTDTADAALWDLTFMEPGERVRLIAQHRLRARQPSPPYQREHRRWEEPSRHRQNTG